MNATELADELENTYPFVGVMEIAATIIVMGRTLGFKVLAEGVETPEQLAFLKKKGCDMYQGYIKSKPLPADEFGELLGHQQKGG